MLVREFHYELPQERIAQQPVEPRDHSRLMVLFSSGRIEHKRFYDLPSFLTGGDVMVFNDTRVIPARLHGMKERGGASVEILLLRETERDVWEALVRPGKRLKPGQAILFGRGELKGEIRDCAASGGRIIAFSGEGPVREAIRRLGQMPLPPYIHAPLKDQDRYQTIYARVDGSAAAPTAGLHFTPELMEKLGNKGIGEAFVTLHVGLDTFRPVRTAHLEDHRIHREFCSVSPETAALIRDSKTQGRRIIAVGTTVARTLETFTGTDGNISSGSAWTDLFIYPGFRFRTVDGLVTNFHLPRSSLLMMVSAFAGRERMFGAYREAIRAGYRFFSFGDAMLICNEKWD
ncbi:MAG: tRNA preQ1(34) S-adenosylmethionine ribosyltransferase-isomerase QueA [Bacillota bacterium]